MPRKKKTNLPLGRVKKEQANGIFEQVKWPESYTSLILGIVVVIIVGILIASFIRGRKAGEISSDKTSVSETQEETKEGNLSSKYTVIEGDTLWGISEKYYKTGFKWVEIAKANNLTNPDIIEIGTKLSVPKLEISEASLKPDQEIAVNSISGTSYTVKTNEFLWDIAVRAYGDGYKWVEIAKANNITNPDFIYTGDVLKIPR